MYIFMKRGKLQNLRDLDQSIWLDFFDREILNSGKLQVLIEENGISGVTVNPSIFEKAISNSSDYDKDIVAFSKQSCSSEETFISLAVKDIRRAADLFQPVYQQTNGADGFVSLEVSPHLAYDTEGTVKQAREFWRAVNRKNVMIKIPGTSEGLRAIRICIREGININITLLFGLVRYRQVVDAYLTGLEDRIKDNQPISDVASVASFFLSRIDVLIDPLLEQKGLREIKGQVAIAAAKKAYEIYKEVFNGDRFKKLEARGATRQRVLWASTSSKDPSVSDVKYVEALIGPQTINTIPMETLEAFNDHGRAESHLEDDVGKATQILALLEEEGINTEAIAQQLEDEGIEKFKKAYDTLLEAIERRKRMVST
jgi:transaldolase/transaldolase/glucose-6-phosphate isomerase